MTPARPTYDILFLCGSLVEGRDGVGDYTRRLAAALRVAGRRVALVATHDKAAERPRTDAQTVDGQRIETFRLPYATAAGERTRYLQELIDRHAPQWISLQYVPHSFNPYGLPLSFVYCLLRLRTGAARWQIMFHELWITPSSRFNLKDRLIHATERLCIHLLLRRLIAPTGGVVHTHLPAYAEGLRGIGAEVNPLPLFANIAPAARSPATDERGSSYRVVFFSQMSTPPAVTDFLDQLQRYLSERGKQLTVTLLGGGAPKVAAMESALRERFPDIDVEALGFQPAGEVSRWLYRSDLAVSPVLRHELGKSGTVAAFLSHGLAVAAPNGARQPGFFPAALNAAVISEFSSTRLTEAVRAAASLDPSIISPARIASTFLETLHPAAAPTRDDAVTPPLR